MIYHEDELRLMRSAYLVLPFEELQHWMNSWPEWFFRYRLVSKLKDIAQKLIWQSISHPDKQLAENERKFLNWLPDAVRDDLIEQILEGRIKLKSFGDWWMLLRPAPEWSHLQPDEIFWRSDLIVAFFRAPNEISIEQYRAYELMEPIQRRHLIEALVTDGKLRPDGLTFRVVE